VDDEELRVGVARESFPGETRVALVPASVPILVDAGMRVVVERGAGGGSTYADAAYEDHGAELGDRDSVFAADVLLQVRTLGANPLLGRDDLERHHDGQVVIGMGEPLTSGRELGELARRGCTVFAMELVPRIARAQSMDVLSSQSTVAGYKAILIAADRLPKLFPMLTTAAGTVAPARVFVIGAGVAGLQAIATARRLGAMVEAYDVRPAAQEEVESLGAKLVPLPLEPGDAEDASGYAKELGESFYRRQQEHLGRVVTGVDVVVSNAAIPGRPAPILLTDEAVHAMAPGSVVIDLAAARGGNCSLTRPDEIVNVNGVTIVGPTNLPASVPYHASQLYARNLSNFLRALVADGRFDPDWEDEVVHATLVARGGEIVNDRVLATLEEVAVP
jgi:proton-translocating NAD(P)+ transhydrogenase subunit alpha